MPSAQVLSIAAGISTVIGLLGLVAYLYFVIVFRHSQNSVRAVVEGEGLFNAEQIVSILAQFRDDDSRLRALEALANLDRKKAERLLLKVKPNVDVSRLTTISTGHYRQLAAAAAALFLVLALIAYASATTSTSVNGKTTEPQQTFETELIKGEAAKVMSGGSGDRRSCGHGRDNKIQICVRPTRAGGELVPQTITLIEVKQSGNVTGWTVTSDTSEQACIELRAATTACEYLVSIEGRASAVEKFPISAPRPKKAIVPGT